MASPVMSRSRTSITSTYMRSMVNIMEDYPFELSTRVPTEKRMDFVVKTLLNAEWQERRVICTKSQLYFALVGEEMVRDHIPLHEITAVEVMGETKELEMLMSSIRESRSLPERRAEIRTVENGFNSGRSYYLQAESKEMCEKIVDNLQRLVGSARLAAHGTYRFKSSQKFVRKIYNSVIFQTISTCFIIANFGVSVYEAQVGFLTNPDSESESIGNQMEYMFVIAFTLELTLNAYGNWLKPFIRNPWSLFDVVIVCISIIGLAPVQFPSNELLLFRSWRVLRIFGKVKSVSKIFWALSYSMVPMTNAFFIIFVVAAIYSIIGVTFFYEIAPEEFLTFCRAFVAMFRITIGSLEWWYERFPATNPDGTVNFWPAFFVITYVIIVNWVLFQVSIAVLLDNFLTASKDMKMEETVKLIQEKQIEKQFKNPLDPLLLRLCKDYLNDADLSARLQELFKVLDSDGSGDLSSQEFQAAMRKLDVTPRIFLSDSDFIAMTRNGALCDFNGRLHAPEFEIVMRDQMRLYTQSRLSSTSEFWATTDAEFTQIGTLKQILMEQLRSRNEQDSALREMRDIIFSLQGVSHPAPAPHVIDRSYLSMSAPPRLPLDGSSHSSKRRFLQDDIVSESMATHASYDSNAKSPNNQTASTLGPTAYGCKPSASINKAPEGDNSNPLRSEVLGVLCSVQADLRAVAEALAAGASQSKGVPSPQASRWSQHPDGSRKKKAQGKVQYSSSMSPVATAAVLSAAASAGSSCQASTRYLQGWGSVSPKAFGNRSTGSPRASEGRRRAAMTSHRRASDSGAPATHAISCGRDGPSGMCRTAPPPIRTQLSMSQSSGSDKSVSLQQEIVGLEIVMDPVGERDLLVRSPASLALAPSGESMPMPSEIEPFIDDKVTANQAEMSSKPLPNCFQDHVHRLDGTLPAAPSASSASIERASWPPSVEPRLTRIDRPYRRPPPPPVPSAGEDPDCRIHTSLAVPTPDLPLGCKTLLKPSDKYQVRAVLGFCTQVADGALTAAGGGGAAPLHSHDGDGGTLSEGCDGTRRGTSDPFGRAASAPCVIGEDESSRLARGRDGAAGEGSTATATRKVSMQDPTRWRRKSTLAAAAAAAAAAQASSSASDGGSESDHSSAAWHAAARRSGGGGGEYSIREEGSVDAAERRQPWYGPVFSLLNRGSVRP